MDININDDFQQIIANIGNTNINLKDFNEIIKKLKPIAFKNDIFFIETSSEFFKKKIEEKYITIISNNISAFYKKQVYIKILLPNDSISNINISDIEINELYKKTHLIKKLNFDSYIVGLFNKNAVKRAKDLINTDKFNLLFISGGVGVGKTHLINAIGNEFFNGNTNVCYLTSDDIYRNIYQYMHNGDKLEEIKNEFEKYDLLLIDDVQMFGGKEKINEIFFNVFNKLLLLNKKIVVTSDKTYDLLVDIEKRIVSRLGSGINIHIDSPDKLSIKKIINVKTKSDNIVLTDEVIEFLSNRTNGDIRTLLSSIVKIIYYCEDENKKTITLSELQQIFISNVFTNELQINPKIVIQTICDYLGVNEELVTSPTRNKKIKHVRDICIYILRTKYKFELKRIGELFSNRKHPTIIESVKKIESELKNDEKIKLEIEKIIGKI